jgi:hypothetical protein
MRRMITHRRQQGFMAIVLVVFLVVFVVIAASIVSMTTSGARGAADHVTASSALFMAESGIEWAARELFDADNPQADCEALEAQSREVNDGGSFEISFAEYRTDSESCLLTSRGSNGAAIRTLTGVIPKQILEGGAEGEGDDIFDDPGLWEESDFQGFNSDPFPGDGVLYLNRNASCRGPTVHTVRSESESNIETMLSPGFSASDEIYFATNRIVSTQAPNAQCQAGDSRLRVALELADGSTRACEWFMIAGTLSPSNCVPDGAPASLTDEFELVMDLGSGFASTDVVAISIQALWGGGVYSIELSDACIGNSNGCAKGGLVGDDPVEEGSWDETP